MGSSLHTQADEAAGSCRPEQTSVKNINDSTPQITTPPKMGAMVTFSPIFRMPPGRQ